MIKPHIVYSICYESWVCIYCKGNWHGVLGYGTTPLDAYNEYMSKMGYGKI